VSPIGQKRLWHELRGGRKVLAPFEIDATEASAPGYRNIFWRLLSRRNPNPMRWNLNPLHFEMILRDENIRTDIHLERNPETDQLESVEQE